MPEINAIFQQLPGIITIVDTQSKIIFTNRYSARLLGFPAANEDSLLGLDPSAMRCPVADNADDYIRQDKMVVETKSPLSILDLQCYADGQQRTLLTRKKPFYDHNDKLIGSICHCAEINNNTFQTLAAYLSKSDQQFYGHTQQRSYTLTNTDKAFDLSQRQLECLFYIIRGKTAKETGHILNISARTVEAHLNSVKKKWVLHRKSSIIEYALNLGLLNYVPPSLLKDHSYLL